MKTAIITGMTKNRVIGKNNKLPWNIKDDLKLFKQLTTDNTVIMGYNTYVSLPDNFRPLPNRNNIVLSRKDIKIEGVQVCNNIKDAINLAQRYNKKIFVIGGAQTYNEALPFVNELCISHIKEDYEGDTYFPEFNEKEWMITEIREFPEFVFKKYIRKK